MSRYSFSKIDTYKKCPKQYYYRYIEKVPETQKNSALKKGSDIHEILEFHNTEKYNEVLNSKDPEIQNIALRFIDSELGKEILSRNSLREFELFLDSNYEPCDKDTAIFVGYIDRINTTENGLELIDYKTGKYKEPSYQDFTQLILYSLYMFKRLKLNEIKIRYVYVEHLLENTLSLTQDSVIYWQDNLNNQIKSIEKSIESNTWSSKPNKLCPWCPYAGLCPDFKGTPKC
ncbi:TPA: PD-(D/E)XK nuclease family protein [Campylobacter coli]|nr:PD-(D/E)XK nuclease family protein [Campylobacter coli]